MLPFVAKLWVTRTASFWMSAEFRKYKTSEIRIKSQSAASETGYSAGKKALTNLICFCSLQRRIAMSSAVFEASTPNTRSQRRASANVPTPMAHPSSTAKEIGKEGRHCRTCLSFFSS